MKDLLERFREKGLRLTPQRVAIIEYLEGNTSHPTAEDIYDAVRMQYPTMSYATVYNTLDALRDMDEVVELTIDPERRHYDPDTTTHHHVICTKCKKIVDVFADYSDAVRLPREVVRDFAITDNRVNFYGLCKRCSNGNIN